MRDQQLLFQVYDDDAANDTFSKVFLSLSGLKKAGIFPYNPSVVINSLPSKQKVNEKRTTSAVSDIVVEMLSTMRYGDELEKKNGKRQKLKIAPGQNVTVDTIHTSELCMIPKNAVSVTKKQKKSNKKSRRISKEIC